MSEARSYSMTDYNDRLLDEELPRLSRVDQEPRFRKNRSFLARGHLELLIRNDEADRQGLRYQTKHRL